MKPEVLLHLEITQLRQSINSALATNSEELLQEVNNAIAEVTKPEAIQRTINSITKAAVIDAVKKEIETYFLYGKGRKTIQELVREKLDDIFEEKAR